VLQEELLTLWSAQARTVIYVTHDIDEAIFMSDRVLVLSGQPGRILTDLTVPFGRPRTPGTRVHPAHTAMRESIWALIRGEVMRVLGGAA
jgi:NitT/TauT family transport system ATP-binding protein